jgi:ABC-type glycerol-3-phosphate transport system substrate-binding protein
MFYLKRSGSFFLALFLLAACVRLPFSNQTGTPSQFSSGTAVSTSSVNVQPTRAVLVTPEVPPSVRVWLPEEFDPANGTPAGNLLKARLEAFEGSHPGVNIEIRTKAQSGPGGLLEALTTASNAAPSTLPDLIALPRPFLEAAALKGLLHPYDGVSSALDGADWYEYARQLGHIQNSTYGLPFAGDALALIYDAQKYSPLATDWVSLTGLGEPLYFPAADPQAAFTMAEYLAGGWQVQDEQGKLALNAPGLAAVLSFYRQAGQNGVMPEWLVNFLDEDQIWEEVNASRASLAIVSISRYLKARLNAGLPEQIRVAPLPTRDGKVYSLANGWVWALGSPLAERQKLAVELAEYLTEAEFLGRWSQAAGYMPSRPGAVQWWSDVQMRSAVDQLASSSRLQPSVDVTSTLGPALQSAVVRVLKEGADPLEAAQTAAQSLHVP